ncbi:hypothetical protein WA1_22260 [Scytonema hofmannii PCC 7110]|uniref:Protein kinase domain-containing protein n=1 Tax=Scytonema hofmannii PCC 7110 TaxID=128403 RepID=A0A139X9Q5_9CYAN|nr:lanthionine synthetase LanC family protein [Scytonema hofmannii]KYC41419.1 hypothetical protein WA1_22260 [Scytonema hofmannii PCC 7110]
MFGNALLKKNSYFQQELIDFDRNYYDIITSFGLKAKTSFPWVMVGETNQVQGWKLHISSIPIEAANLLARVVPFLKKHQCVFKVALDMSILYELNEGNLGSTQIGKFITVYPRSNYEARFLAETLVEITQYFSGPVIVTDLRLGDVVYTRYGSFNSIQSQDRLGLSVSAIYTSNGSLEKDSYSVPFVPPHDVANPFTDFFISSEPYHSLVLTGESPLSHESDKLFGPGYLFLEVIKQHPKGAVFRGIDLRSQENVSIKIIKQGRQHCVSDEYGRDIRTRLQRQESLHNFLYGLVPIPKVDPYFEVKGDGYLPIEYIEGQSLDSLVSSSLTNRSWRSLSLSAKTQLLSYLEKLISAVQALHGAGYVHRDLTGANIWIGADEKVYLLDLELAHNIKDNTPAFILGTPGFMSPEQEAGEPPAFTDDIYAIGCLIILLLTGLPPHLLLFANEQNRVNQWLELTHDVPIELVEIAAQCVKCNAIERPDLQQIKMTVLESKAGLISCINTQDFASLSIRSQINDFIVKGQQGLLDAVISDRTTGLWLSSSVNNMLHQDIKAVRFYEVRRSANTGVAGVVYLLSRLARFGYDTEAVRDRVQKAIQWLLWDDTTPDKQLPGLHFGEAGVAVAIAEAISSGLIQRDRQIDAFLMQALSGKLDWSDITHGAAGQGVAVLYCADRLQDATLLGLVHRCANYLINTQKDDGSWETPPGVENMSGQILTGFAHGVSGIVYFLSEYAYRFDSSAAEKAWQTGADWLFEQAHLTQDQQGLEWYVSDTQKDKWKWWCHGSPGIALTFLRLYEHTKNDAYAEIAIHALQAHPIDMRHRNLSQCHGLSGLGEIYLEAARILGDRQWLERAENIAKTLIALRQETDRSSITWLVENLYQPTADLMIGAGGIIHFLLRLSLQAEKIGFPLLLDPIK